MNRGALVNTITVRVAMPGCRTQTGSLGRGRTRSCRSSRQRSDQKEAGLHVFHILWEVEKWELTPPRDPALLRWIGGDLWEVVATWDLTQLERAVLSR